MTPYYQEEVRWPVGSCPECYDGGTPLRPICLSHGHELLASGVVVCDTHRHLPRVINDGAGIGEGEMGANTVACSHPRYADKHCANQSCYNYVNRCPRHAPSGSSSAGCNRAFASLPYRMA